MADKHKLRTESLKNAPRDCWVALSDETVVAFGATYEEAVRKSASAGIRDPVLVKTPKIWSPTSF
jgi:hypothetical protein